MYGQCHYLPDSQLHHQHAYAYMTIAPYTRKGTARQSTTSTCAVLQQRKFQLLLYSLVGHPYVLHVICYFIHLWGIPMYSM
jgi:hypothetical protein